MLRIWRAGEDHPKACTARKLLRLGQALPFQPTARDGVHPVVLDPRASTPLSAVDRPPALRDGVLAVDCSWNRLHERNGLPESIEGWLNRQPYRRRLPWLFASNPQHYGHLAELNTAEALGAALHLLGEPGRGQELLGSFPGGDSFWTLNRTLLERYVSAPGPVEIRQAERELF